MGSTSEVILTYTSTKSGQLDLLYFLLEDSFTTQVKNTVSPVNQIELITSYLYYLEWMNQNLHQWFLHI